MACSIFAFINIYGSSLNNPLLIIEACFKLVSIMPNTCYHLALTLTAFFFYFLLPSSLLLAQPSRSKFKSSCNNQYFSCIALCIPPDTRIGIKFSVLRVLDCISIILESIQVSCCASIDKKYQETSNAVKFSLVILTISYKNVALSISTTSL